MIWAKELNLCGLLQSQSNAGWKGLGEVSSSEPCPEPAVRSVWIALGHIHLGLKNPSPRLQIAWAVFAPAL